jgi:hypothetical protein
MSLEIPTCWGLHNTKRAKIKKCEKVAKIKLSKEFSGLFLTEGKRKGRLDDPI